MSPIKLAAAAVLAGVTLAVGAGQVGATFPAPTGERINILTGSPTEFPTGEPFFVAHGWNPQPDLTDYDALGRLSFALDVDGQPAELSFKSRWAEDGRLVWFWVYNFPQGLPAGFHTFTGRWSGPCQRLAELGYDVGEPCRTPTEVRLAGGPLTHFVTFGTNLALGKPATASSE